MYNKTETMLESRRYIHFVRFFLIDRLKFAIQIYNVKVAKVLTGWSAILLVWSIVAVLGTITFFAAVHTSVGVTPKFSRVALWKYWIIL